MTVLLDVALGLMCLVVPALAVVAFVAMWRRR